MKLRYFLTAFVALMLAIPATTSAEPPAEVPIQGYITDSEGVPIDDSTEIDVEIFDAQSGGTALHSETLTVDPEAGSFTAYLGTESTLDLSIFQANTDLWAEVTVDGETLQPRLKIATAPYAAATAFSQNAGQLGGEDPSAYTYDAGTGLSLNGSTFTYDSTEIQTRVSGSCSGGEFAVGVNEDGTLICDTAASVTAGAGLDLSGNTMSVASDGIEASMIQTGAVTTDEIADGTITSADISSNTIGQGDIGSGAIGSSELQTNAVESTHINSGAVTSDKIASGAVGTDEIADGSITADDIGEYGCDSNTQFLDIEGCGPFQDRIDNGSSLADVPDCDQVPVGGFCEGGSCPNTDNSLNNCTGPGLYEIYQRTSQ